MVARQARTGQLAVCSFCNTTINTHLGAGRGRNQDIHGTTIEHSAESAKGLAVERREIAKLAKGRLAVDTTHDDTAIVLPLPTCAQVNAEAAAVTLLSGRDRLFLLNQRLLRDGEACRRRLAA